MTHSCRVWSGVLLLLAVLGLPVASVICELACPRRASVPASATTVPTATVASARAVSPCHDADITSATPLVAGLDAEQRHQCEHPTVLTLPRAPEGLVTPASSVAHLDATVRLSSFSPAAAADALRAAARARARTPGRSRSPVLRI